MSWWVIFCFSFLTYARLSCVKFNNSKCLLLILCLYRSYGKVSHLNYQKKKNYSFTCFNLLVELSISRKESRVKEIWATLLYCDYLRWPKVSRQFQFYSRQFQFAHDNFNLFRAISICSRQFQFTQGNFNLLTAILITAISILLTAISIYSRQFRNFTQGNLNIWRQRSRHFSLLSPPVSYCGRQWPRTKSQNAKSKVDHVKVDLQREKWKSQSKVDLRTTRKVPIVTTPRK